MTDVNICISCDDNYSKYAGVVIASVLANFKSDENLNIYILDGGISDIKKQQILSLKSMKNCNINFVKINENDFEDYKEVCTHKYLTIAACYRLKLASLLPDVDKVIYFDCDIIVNSDLTNLFNIDIEDYAIAGVKDINKKMLKRNPNYINSGVLLLNLDKWRKDNIEQKLLEFTKANIDNIKTGDQEIINRCLSDYIKIIDDKWNVQSSNFTNRSSYTSEPKIIHFVSKNKPWGLKSFSYHKNLYFKYLQLTPWKLDDKELKQALKSTALSYFKYRPFFLLRPRFYEALVKTYILKNQHKFISKNKRFLFFKDIDSHYVIQLLCLIQLKFKHKVKFKYKNVTEYGLTVNKRHPQLIVSLTSFPERIDKIDKTINTLLNQTIKPDKLILWLAYEQFPNRENDLPENLLKLKNYGLEIMWCEDLK
ncbi:MAG: glycosyltransferase family 8 protein, partial [bacterium]|nr:glycosyltransferase family 8 protein [bacterium]